MIVGVLLALATSVSWAFGNVFIKKSGQAAGTARGMLWAMVAGGLAAGGLSLVLDVRTAPITSSALAWTGLAGASGLVAYLCLFHAFEHAPLSLAVPVVSSWSVVAGALSLTVFGERVRALPAVGAAVVFAGVVLVAVGGSREPQGEPPSSAARHRQALWAALGAAAGFGVMVPSLAQVGPALGAFGATAAVYGVGVALGLPLALVVGADLRPPPRAVWGLLLLTGCFETLGFVCVSFARRHAPLALVTPVSSLASALTVLYAWLVLRERPHPVAAAGALLASAGVVLLSL